MMKATADLARSITWNGSKQTYYTARLMVDKDLVDDFLRAYAYFRWADDIIDVSSRSEEERISFITRQKSLVDQLYRCENPGMLTPEEEIIADLIRNDRWENSGLQSFIRNMLGIIAFDAHRKGRVISQEELTRYSECLSRSVTDGLQYFIGNGYPYRNSENQYLAATGAHVAHLLRDMVRDTADGFINIPREYLDQHRITPVDLESNPFRAWVKERVELARRYFEEGRRYLDDLGVLRCKIVGHWYCARFEGVLDAIERDGYILREVYREGRKFSSWFKIAGMGLSLTFRHKPEKETGKL
ncbi:MAG: squalene/phytoene synthase family protein [Anaerolineales bacterium]|nr:squalene/phytoene synthase family protein [Anaerolineales bacterium]